MHKYRTHLCGNITAKEVEQEVKISGWLHNKRDHGGVLFLDVRDHYGIVQAVIEEKDNAALYNDLTKVKLESVLTITAIVKKRADSLINKQIPTGEIELSILTAAVESPCEQIPFQVNTDDEVGEEIRLRHRFLDMRRKGLHDSLILRSKVVEFLRKEMISKGFLEITTPILTSSSPEGARDFLVPSRLNPGKFYALPQAPQQFKQLLMCSGFDKYFQIAPCFRDEDARSDRSPGEFYQLDMEMAYVEQEDVFGVIEPVMRETFKNFGRKPVSDKAFARIKYKDALEKYGSDKPDLRNPIVNAIVTDAFSESNFEVFAKGIKNHGSIVCAIPAPKAAGYSRKFFDDMIGFAVSEGAKGLAYIIFEENGEVKSPIAKFLSAEQIESIKNRAGLQNGDAVFFSCDQKLKAYKIAGLVRNRAARELRLLDDSEYKFCWITDFPYFEWNEEENRLDFSHNPFSMPQGGIEALNSKDPLEIDAYQYDIVCDGIELSSGAIRNHRLDIIYKAFEMVGYKKEVVTEKFNCMVKAFQYGAPPHGGIAPGVDRIVMLLAGTETIRDVIAFPLNGNGEDLLMNAPSEVTEKQLRELGILVKKRD